ncbi:hypothetical protein H112_02056 [Trichophyton rubrum D6]|uniref:BZIP transcription factor n=5 Tax=Trichophyton TaxID=5550 RepID=A0A178EZ27_TRIRU|nr:uncharacterized protein TERG_06815 [Trichophyton rubrum CBS 118892]EZF25748.1 hypothetical protein H100_02054 [Trichophyton rubrum MR850]EZF44759.1 hypothetical protein H102_02049 [Trichophyton rubrum CBS 100081]EZF55355.1 hypothetical protein H103_02059 [Trichophyton rubrum CBS 288.86]EZF65969.1 hypothetical protein H104_02036 [Trichophyton rubrum CBS 289.86]EZF76603.1 hypothetical protein H105_02068 [Trichophyton soudanense CBS 452.61]EZF98071.1 hypothetical protein H113_02060 [Trichophy
MAADTGLYNSSEPVHTMPSPAPNDSNSNGTTNGTHPTANHDNENSHPSTTSSSSSVSDVESERKSRADRPRIASRKPSASILVPRDHPEIEIEKEEFPPDDARAMSPRRNFADVKRLGTQARLTLKEQAKTLQSSLQALADRIDEVKSDHDKLENENRFLQDYIGGLTRTMSTKSELTSTSGAGKGKKAQK